ncbi:MAG: M20/M25/M40 family metallo-hydrolase, partial [Planctomycetota bacterium]
MRSLIVVALGLTATFPLAAGSPVAEKSPVAKIIELGKEDNRVMDHLDYLVNNIGARLTASDNDVKACEWSRDLFEDWGLENAKLEEAGSFPVEFNRGPWSGRMNKPENMLLEFGTPAWSAGTDGKVTGPAVLAPKSIDGLDAADFAGAWIVSERAQGRRNREEQQRQREIQNFLREAGVAGFVSSSGSKYIRVSGRSPRSFDQIPTIPRITMLGDHFDKIKAHLEAGTEVELTFDIRNHFEPGPAVYYNTVAEITGTEFPDECVIIGGHIDSWDGATGTTDNGCGVAVAMEAARLLMESGAKPRRTIRFQLWSGEEQGLLGSRAWIEQNPNLLDGISAVFVYDGGPNAIAAVNCTNEMLPHFEKALAPIMGLNDMPFEIRPAAVLRSGAGSDHASFIQKGIPGFFWTQEGRADWRHGIHTQFDTYDLAIPEYMEHSATVVALAALGVANLDQKLPRDNIQSGRGGGGGGGGRRMGVFLDGVAVEEVVPNGVAANAGLKAGDVFVSIDTQKIENRRGLVRAIQTGEPRKKVKIKRDGKEME